LGSRLDPADDQAVNSRLLILQQKMHGSQRCYGEFAELIVDDIWQVAYAGDQKRRETGTLQASRHLSGVSGCSIHGIASPMVQEGGTWVGKGKGYNCPCSENYYI